MTTNHYLNELKLTLENTESLYHQALAVTDFDWQGDQIIALHGATWAQVNANAGHNVAPAMITDKDVREVMQVIIDTTKTLQSEANS